MTSLVHIKGGKKLFFDNLQKRTGKWNHTLNQNRKHNILNGSPMYCENSKQPVHIIITVKVNPSMTKQAGKSEN